MNKDWYFQNGLFKFFEKIAKRFGGAIVFGPHWERIAKYKCDNFPANKWKLCPLYKGDSERYCISKKCLKEIIEHGECQCQMYKFNEKFQ